MIVDRSYIIALNEGIQANIFDYNACAVPARVVDYFEAILASGILSRLEANELQRFNHFMAGCLQAMQNKDYLNLADLLQYEILPLLTRAPR